MTADLSRKQLEVLEFIQRFAQDHPYPPTRAEIAEGLGLRNRQGIDQHLRALEKKGAIGLTPGVARGIRLRDAGATRLAMRPTQLTLPLVGRIAAGAPILATGNIEDEITIDPGLFQPRADFLLRVRGDSMRDADIMDRDLLVVHQTPEARDGQIIVARLGEEATVKFFRPCGDHVRLEPANEAYQPIEVDLRSQHFSIEGLAVGVIRTGLGEARAQRD